MLKSIAEFRALHYLYGREDDSASSGMGCSGIELDEEGDQEDQGGSGGVRQDFTELEKIVGSHSTAKLSR